MLALWDANIVLTSFFVLEVVMKLWALGFFEYFTDGFNVFDFLIVCVALTEIILAAIVGLGALRCVAPCHEPAGWRAGAACGCGTGALTRAECVALLAPAGPCGRCASCAR